MTRKKAWMSWSSGKDSAYALHLLRQRPDIEVVGLLTTVTEEYRCVAMHAVREDLLERQAQLLGLELIRVKLPSPCSNEIYEARMKEALAEAVSRNISFIGFGDLFLEEIRLYREKMLESTGIAPLFPLWGRPTGGLAKEMIDSGIRAVITCVDPRKMAKQFAGRDFDQAFLEEIPPEVDPCGENGEFHTFVYDAPGFQNPISLQRGEVVERDGFIFADVLRASVGQKTCERCGTVFSCGTSEPGTACWCMSLPPLDPLPNDAKDCLCGACLRSELRKGEAGF